MVEFKNGILIENVEDFNEIKKLHKINFTREELENFVLDVTEMLPEELESYSFETLLEILHEAEWMVFFDYSNGYELRFNDYFTGDFYGCEIIDKDKKTFCYIDYEQFLNSSDRIFVYLPTLKDSIEVKFSLYGNIIEILDDRVYDYLDIIKDIITGKKEKTINIDIYKPYYTTYINELTHGGFSVKKVYAAFQ